MIAVTVLWSGGQGEGLLPECCGRVRRKASVGNKARCRNWVTCHCLKNNCFFIPPWIAEGLLALYIEKIPRGTQAQRRQKSSIKCVL
jgi:hypothetical protein